MNRRHLVIGSLAGGILLIGGLAGFALKAWADGIPSPNPLYYSGTLTESGQLVNGTRAMTVNLWPDGTTQGTPLCSTVVSSPPVTVVNGRFRIALASACKAVINQNSNAYVEVIDGATSLGRVAIGAVPYAVEADHAVNADNAVNAADGGGLATGLSSLSDSVSSISSSVSSISSLVHPASGFRAWTETGVTIAPSSNQTIVFDQVDYDLASEYDKTTGVFTPKSSGIYLVTCILNFASNSMSADFAVTINDNGTGIGLSEQVYVGADVSPEYTSVVQLTAGDALTCSAFQNSNSNQGLHGGTVGRNAFTATRLY